MIPRKTIDEIREKVDIIELIESTGVTLTATGSRHRGLCPVHSERTPSFYVNKLSGTFHCFGCGISGDAVQYLKEVEGYSFAGAVEALGELVGVEVIDTAGEDPEYQRKKEYLQCVGLAAWYYRSKFNELPESHPAKLNLSSRNFLHVEGRETWIEDFGMGYAPEGYDKLSTFLRSKGYTPEQIVDAGLAFQNDRNGKLVDRFRNRLLWEIRDVQKHPIGFSGRRLNEEDNPKYLNTSETIMYKKSRIVYGIDLARKKMAEDRTCFVTEGAADVMAVAAVGATNVVASCGTAFGNEHVSVIRRIIDDYNASNSGRFVFVFDGDEAGLKAAARMFYDIKPSIKERSYVVPMEGLDPAEYRMQYGDEALREALYEKQIPLTEFILQRIYKKYDMSEIESQNAFANESMSVISYIEEPAIYEAYKRKISAMSGISLGHLPGNPSTRMVEEPPMPDEQPQNEPMPDPFGEVSRKPVYNPNDPLERSTRLLTACMLQFPLETFKALFDKPEILNCFQNESLKDILYKGMNKAGYTAVKNEPTKLSVVDFEDSDEVIPLFNMLLDTDEEKVGQYIDYLIGKIRSIKNKQEVDALRLEGIMGTSTQMELLKKMMDKRSAIKQQKGM